MARSREIRRSLARRAPQARPVWTCRPVPKSHGLVPGTGPWPKATWPPAGARLEAEVLRDHHVLYLVRALADLEDLLVAVEARDRVLVHVAIAAVDLQRCIDDA